MNEFHDNRMFPEPGGYLEAYDMSAGMWLPMSSQAREEEKERDYWQQLYPAEVRQVQRAVERACDQADYEGSFLYDEYPDRIALQRMCQGIAQMIAAGETGTREGELHAMAYCSQCGSQTRNRIIPPIQPGPRPPRPNPNPGPRPPRPNPNPGPRPPMPGPNPGPNPTPPEPTPNWQHLIQILLFDEISRRRRNRRRYWRY